MNETRQRILEGKDERETLELKAHWALTDLSNYYRKQVSPLMYQINIMLRELDRVREESRREDEQD